MKKLRTFLDKVLNDHTSKIFLPVQVFLAVATVVSIVTIILETVPELAVLSGMFLIIEWVAAGIFTVEYLARLSTAEKKLGYALSLWGIIDLISILPTFLGLANFTFLKSVRTLRILRLMRIFRLAKISRAYISTHNKAKTQADFNHINVAIYFIALTSVTVLFGSILYVVEGQQADYMNIPSAMLQVVRVLLGGVGYGPISTIAGEVIILLIRFIGLAMFGFLITIIGGVLKEWLLGAEKA